MMVRELCAEKKEAEAIAHKFLPAIGRFVLVAPELNVNLLRETIEFFIYAHEGRAPTDPDELLEWATRVTRSGMLKFNPIQ